MTKVISYTALHYGADYLGWAIRSVIDHVDEHHILYSAVGSHGHRTAVACPDTRAQLFAIAQDAAGDKLRWHDGEWGWEGQQRDSIHSYAPDADVVLVVDADEIWPGDHLEHLLKSFQDGLYAEPYARLRLPMIHMWRSFYRAVLHDPALPERVIFPKVHSGYVGAREGMPIVHFGYAQRSEVVEYKQLTHGHKAEWRRDCDWFRDRFMANAQVDCHPVGSEWWQPESVDPWAYLPDFMRSHPYAEMAVIP